MPLATRTIKKIGPAEAGPYDRTLRTERLASDALHGDVLRAKDFVLQCIHAGGGFVDAADERD